MLKALSDKPSPSRDSNKGTRESSPKVQISRPHVPKNVPGGRFFVGNRQKFLKIAKGEKTIANASLLNKELHSYVSLWMNTNQRTDSVLRLTLKKFMFVHLFNCKVAQATNIYLIDKNLKDALAGFMKISVNVLRNPTFAKNKEFNQSLKDSITRLLWSFYSKYHYYLKQTPTKGEIWESIYTFMDLELPSSLPEVFNDLLDSVKKLLPPKPVGTQVPYFIENIDAFLAKRRSAEDCLLVEEPVVVDLCSSDSEVEGTQCTNQSQGAVPRQPILLSSESEDEDVPNVPKNVPAYESNHPVRRRRRIDKDAMVRTRKEQEAVSQVSLQTDNIAEYVAQQAKMFMDNIRKLTGKDDISIKSVNGKVEVCLEPSSSHSKVIPPDIADAPCGNNNAIGRESNNKPIRQDFGLPDAYSRNLENPPLHFPTEPDIPFPTCLEKNSGEQSLDSCTRKERSVEEPSQLYDNLSIGVNVSAENRTITPFVESASKESDAKNNTEEDVLLADSEDDRNISNEDLDEDLLLGDVELSGSVRSFQNTEGSECSTKDQNKKSSIQETLVIKSAERPTPCSGQPQIQKEIIHCQDREVEDGSPTLPKKSFQFEMTYEEIEGSEQQDKPLEEPFTQSVETTQKTFDIESAEIVQACAQTLLQKENIDGQDREVGDGTHVVPKKSFQPGMAYEEIKHSEQDHITLEEPVRETTEASSANEEITEVIEKFNKEKIVDEAIRTIPDEDKIDHVIPQGEPLEVTSESMEARANQQNNTTIDPILLEKCKLIVQALNQINIAGDVAAKTDPIVKENLNQQNMSELAGLDDFSKSLHSKDRSSVHSIEKEKVTENMSDNFEQNVANHDNVPKEIAEMSLIKRTKTLELLPMDIPLKERTNDAINIHSSEKVAETLVDHLEQNINIESNTENIKEVVLPSVLADSLAETTDKIKETDQNIGKESVPTLSSKEQVQVDSSLPNRPMKSNISILSHTVVNTTPYAKDSTEKSELVQLSFGEDRNAQPSEQSDKTLEEPVRKTAEASLADTTDEIKEKDENVGKESVPTQSSKEQVQVDSSLPNRPMKSNISILSHTVVNTTPYAKDSTEKSELVQLSFGEDRNVQPSEQSDKTLEEPVTKTAEASLAETTDEIKEMDQNFGKEFVPTQSSKEQVQVDSLLPNRPMESNISILSHTVVNTTPYTKDSTGKSDLVQLSFGEDNNVQPSEQSGKTLEEPVTKTDEAALAETTDKIKEMDQNIGKESVPTQSSKEQVQVDSSLPNRPMKSNISILSHTVVNTTPCAKDSTEKSELVQLSFGEDRKAQPSEQSGKTLEEPVRKTAEASLAETTDEMKEIDQNVAKESVPTQSSKDQFQVDSSLTNRPRKTNISILSHTVVNTTPYTINKGSTEKSELVQLSCGEDRNVQTSDQNGKNLEEPVTKTAEASSANEGITETIEKLDKEKTRSRKSNISILSHRVMNTVAYTINKDPMEKSELAQLSREEDRNAQTSENCTTLEEPVTKTAEAGSANEEITETVEEFEEEKIVYEILEVDKPIQYMEEGKMTDNVQDKQLLQDLESVEISQQSEKKLEQGEESAIQEPPRDLLASIEKTQELQVKEVPEDNERELETQNDSSVHVKKSEYKSGSHEKNSEFVTKDLTTNVLMDKHSTSNIEGIPEETPKLDVPESSERESFQISDEQAIIKNVSDAERTNTGEDILPTEHRNQSIVSNLEEFIIDSNIKISEGDDNKEDLENEESEFSENKFFEKQTNSSECQSICPESNVVNNVELENKDFVEEEEISCNKSETFKETVKEQDENKTEKMSDDAQIVSAEEQVSLEISPDTTVNESLNNIEDYADQVTEVSVESLTTQREETVTGSNIEFTVNEGNIIKDVSNFEYIPDDAQAIVETREERDQEATLGSANNFESIPAAEDLKDLNDMKLTSCESQVETGLTSSLDSSQVKSDLKTMLVIDTVQTSTTDTTINDSLVSTQPPEVALKQEPLKNLDDFKGALELLPQDHAESIPAAEVLIDESQVSALKGEENKRELKTELTSRLLTCESDESQVKPDLKVKLIIDTVQTSTSDNITTQPPQEAPKDHNDSKDAMELLPQDHQSTIVHHQVIEADLNSKSSAELVPCEPSDEKEESKSNVNTKSISSDTVKLGKSNILETDNRRKSNRRNLSRKMPYTLKKHVKPIQPAKELDRTLSDKDKIDHIIPQVKASEVTSESKEGFAVQQNITIIDHNLMEKSKVIVQEIKQTNIAGDVDTDPIVKVLKIPNKSELEPLDEFSKSLHPKEMTSTEKVTESISDNFEQNVFNDGNIPPKEIAEVSSTESTKILELSSKDILTKNTTNIDAVKIHSSEKVAEKIKEHLEQNIKVESNINIETPNKIKDMDKDTGNDFGPTKSSKEQRQRNSSVTILSNIVVKPIPSYPLNHDPIGKAELVQLSGEAKRAHISSLPQASKVNSNEDLRNPAPDETVAYVENFDSFTQQQYLSREIHENKYPDPNEYIQQAKKASFCDASTLSFSSNEQGCLNANVLSSGISNIASTSSSSSDVGRVSTQNIENTEVLTNNKEYTTPVDALLGASRSKKSTAEAPVESVVNYAFIHQIDANVVEPAKVPFLDPSHCSDKLMTLAGLCSLLNSNDVQSTTDVTANSPDPSDSNDSDLTDRLRIDEGWLREPEEKSITKIQKTAAKSPGRCRTKAELKFMSLKEKITSSSEDEVPLTARIPKTLQKREIIRRGRKPSGLMICKTTSATFGRGRGGRQAFRKTRSQSHKSVAEEQSSEVSAEASYTSKLRSRSKSTSDKDKQVIENLVIQDIKPETLLPKPTKRRGPKPKKNLEETPALVQNKPTKLEEVQKTIEEPKEVPLKLDTQNKSILLEPYLTKISSTPKPPPKKRHSYLEEKIARLRKILGNEETPLQDLNDVAANSPKTEMPTTVPNVDANMLSIRPTADFISENISEMTADQHDCDNRYSFKDGLRNNDWGEEGLKCRSDENTETTVRQVTDNQLVQNPLVSIAEVIEQSTSPTVTEPGYDYSIASLLKDQTKELRRASVDQHFSESFGFSHPASANFTVNPSETSCQINKQIGKDYYSTEDESCRKPDDSFSGYEEEVGTNFAQDQDSYNKVYDFSIQKPQEVLEKEEFKGHICEAHLPELNSSTETDILDNNTAVPCPQSTPMDATSLMGTKTNNLNANITPYLECNPSEANILVSSNDELLGNGVIPIFETSPVELNTRSITKTDSLKECSAVPLGSTSCEGKVETDRNVPILGSTSTEINTPSAIATHKSCDNGNIPSFESASPEETALPDISVASNLDIPKLDDSKEKLLTSDCGGNKSSDVPEVAATIPSISDTEIPVHLHSKIKNLAEKFTDKLILSDCNFSEVALLQGDSQTKIEIICDNIKTKRMAEVKSKDSKSMRSENKVKDNSVPIVAEVETNKEFAENQKKKSEGTKELVVDLPRSRESSMDSIKEAFKHKTQADGTQATLDKKKSRSRGRRTSLDQKRVSSRRKLSFEIKSAEIMKDESSKTEELFHSNVGTSDKLGENMIKEASTPVEKPRDEITDGRRGRSKAKHESYKNIVSNKELLHSNIPNRDELEAKKATVTVEKPPEKTPDGRRGRSKAKDESFKKQENNMPDKELAHSDKPSSDPLEKNKIENAISTGESLRDKISEGRRGRPKALFSEKQTEVELPGQDDIKPRRGRSKTPKFTADTSDDMSECRRGQSKTHGEKIKSDNTDKLFKESPRETVSKHNQKVESNLKRNEKSTQLKTETKKDTEVKEKAKEVEVLRANKAATVEKRHLTEKQNRKGDEKTKVKGEESGDIKHQIKKTKDEPQMEEHLHTKDRRVSTKKEKETEKIKLKEEKSKSKNKVEEKSRDKTPSKVDKKAEKDARQDKVDHKDLRSKEHISKKAQIEENVKNKSNKELKSNKGDFETRTREKNTRLDKSKPSPTEDRKSKSKIKESKSESLQDNREEALKPKRKTDSVAKCDKKAENVSAERNKRKRKIEEDPKIKEKGNNKIAKVRDNASHSIDSSGEIKPKVTQDIIKHAPKIIDKTKCKLESTTSREPDRKSKRRKEEHKPLTKEKLSKNEQVNKDKTKTKEEEKSVVSLKINVNTPNTAEKVKHKGKTAEEVHIEQKEQTSAKFDALKESSSILDKKWKSFYEENISKLESSRDTPSTSKIEPTNAEKPKEIMLSCSEQLTKTPTKNSGDVSLDPIKTKKTIERSKSKSRSEDKLKEQDKQFQVSLETNVNTPNTAEKVKHKGKTVEEETFEQKEKTSIKFDALKESSSILDKQWKNSNEKNIAKLESLRENPPTSKIEPTNAAKPKETMLSCSEQLTESPIKNSGDVNLDTIKTKKTIERSKSKSRSKDKLKEQGKQFDVHTPNTAEKVKHKGKTLEEVNIEQIEQTSIKFDALKESSLTLDKKWKISNEENISKLEPSRDTPSTSKIEPTNAEKPKETMLSIGEQLPKTPTKNSGDVNLDTFKTKKTIERSKSKSRSEDKLKEQGKQCEVNTPDTVEKVKHKSETSEEVIIEQKEKTSIQFDALKQSSSTLDKQWKNSIQENISKLESPRGTSAFKIEPTNLEKPKETMLSFSEQFPKTPIKNSGDVNLDTFQTKKTIERSKSKSRSEGKLKGQGKQCEVNTPDTDEKVKHKGKTSEEVIIEQKENTSIIFDALKESSSTLDKQWKNSIQENISKLESPRGTSASKIEPTNAEKSEETMLSISEQIPKSPIKNSGDVNLDTFKTKKTIERSKSKSRSEDKLKEQGKQCEVNAPDTVEKVKHKGITSEEVIIQQKENTSIIFDALKESSSTLDKEWKNSNEENISKLESPRGTSASKIEPRNAEKPKETLLSASEKLPKIPIKNSGDVNLDTFKTKKTIEQSKSKSRSEDKLKEQGKQCEVNTTDPVEKVKHKGKTLEEVNIKQKEKAIKIDALKESSSTLDKEWKNSNEENILKLESPRGTSASKIEPINAEKSKEPILSCSEELTKTPIKNSGDVNLDTLKTKKTIERSKSKSRSDDKVKEKGKQFDVSLEINVNTPSTTEKVKHKGKTSEEVNIEQKEKTTLKIDALKESSSTLDKEWKNSNEENIGKLESPGGTLTSKIEPTNAGKPKETMLSCSEQLTKTPIKNAGDVNLDTIKIKRTIERSKSRSEDKFKEQGKQFDINTRKTAEKVKHKDKTAEEENFAQKEKTSINFDALKESSTTLDKQWKNSNEENKLESLRGNLSTSKIEPTNTERPKETMVSCSEQLTKSPTKNSGDVNLDTFKTERTIEKSRSEGKLKEQGKQFKKKSVIQVESVVIFNIETTDHPSKIGKSNEIVQLEYPQSSSSDSKVIPKVEQSISKKKLDLTLKNDPNCKKADKKQSIFKSEEKRKVQESVKLYLQESRSMKEVLPNLDSKKKKIEPVKPNESKNVSHANTAASMEKSKMSEKQTLKVEGISSTVPTGLKPESIKEEKIKPTEIVSSDLKNSAAVPERRQRRVTSNPEIVGKSNLIVAKEQELKLSNLKQEKQMAGHQEVSKPVTSVAIKSKSMKGKKKDTNPTERQFIAALDSKDSPAEEHQVKEALKSKPTPLQKNKKVKLEESNIKEPSTASKILNTTTDEKSKDIVSVQLVPYSKKAIDASEVAKKVVEIPKENISRESITDLKSNDLSAKNDPHFKVEDNSKQTYKEKGYAAQVADNKESSTQKVENDPKVDCWIPAESEPVSDSLGECDTAETLFQDHDFSVSNHEEVHDSSKMPDSPPDVLLLEEIAPQVESSAVEKHNVENVLVVKPSETLQPSIPEVPKKSLATTATIHVSKFEQSKKLTLPIVGENSDVLIPSTSKLDVKRYVPKESQLVNKRTQDSSRSPLEDKSKAQKAEWSTMSSDPVVLNQTANIDTASSKQKGIEIKTAHYVQQMSNNSDTDEKLYTVLNSIMENVSKESRERSRERRKRRLSKESDLPIKKKVDVFLIPPSELETGPPPLKYIRRNSETKNVKVEYLPQILDVQSHNISVHQALDNSSTFNPSQEQKQLPEIKDAFQDSHLYYTNPRNPAPAQTPVMDQQQFENAYGGDLNFDLFENDNMANTYYTPGHPDFDINFFQDNASVISSVLSRLDQANSEKNDTPPSGPGIRAESSQKFEHSYSSFASGVAVKKCDSVIPRQQSQDPTIADPASAFESILSEVDTVLNSQGLGNTGSGHLVSQMANYNPVYPDANLPAQGNHINSASEPPKESVQQTMDSMIGGCSLETTLDEPNLQDLFRCNRIHEPDIKTVGVGDSVEISSTLDGALDEPNALHALFCLHSSKLQDADFDIIDDVVIKDAEAQLNANGKNEKLKHNKQAINKDQASKPARKASTFDKPKIPKKQEYIPIRSSGRSRMKPPPRRQTVESTGSVQAVVTVKPPHELLITEPPVKQNDNVQKLRETVNTEVVDNRVSATIISNKPAVTVEELPKEPFVPHTMDSMIGGSIEQTLDASNLQEFIPSAGMKPGVDDSNSCISGSLDGGLDEPNLQAFFYLETGTSKHDAELQYADLKSLDIIGDGDIEHTEEIELNTSFDMSQLEEDSKTDESLEVSLSEPMVVPQLEESKAQKPTSLTTEKSQQNPLTVTVQTPQKSTEKRKQQEEVKVASSSARCKPRNVSPKRNSVRVRPVQELYVEDPPNAKLTDNKTKALATDNAASINIDPKPSCSGILGGKKPLPRRSPLREGTRQATKILKKALEISQTETEKEDDLPKRGSLEAFDLLKSIPNQPLFDRHQKEAEKTSKKRKRTASKMCPKEENDGNTWYPEDKKPSKSKSEPYQMEFEESRTVYNKSGDINWDQTEAGTLKNKAKTESQKCKSDPHEPEVKEDIAYRHPGKKSRKSESQNKCKSEPYQPGFEESRRTSSSKTDDAPQNSQASKQDSSKSHPPSQAPDTPPEKWKEDQYGWLEKLPNLYFHRSGNTLSKDGADLKGSTYGT